MFCSRGLPLVGVVVVVALACAVAVAHAEAEEEDSDIEYLAPQHKPAVGRRGLNARRQQAAEEGNDADDDLLEGGSEEQDLGRADPEATPSPEKEQVKMVRRFEKQEHFLVEMAYLTVVVFAISTYFSGKTKNTEIAQTWLTQHISLLMSNFTNVGDSGNFDEPTTSKATKEKESKEADAADDGEEESEGDNEEEDKDEEAQQKRPRPTLVRENASNLSIFCSGRRHCNSCLFKFELCARQDLLSVVYGFFAKSLDELVITIELGDNDMSAPLSFAVVPNRQHKEWKETRVDLAKCEVSKPGQRGLPKQHVLVSENEGAAFEVLTPIVRETIDSKWFKSLHVTDNNPYASYRSKKVIQLVCYLPTKQSEMGMITPLVQLALRLVDTVHSTKLGEKEAKAVRQFRESLKSEQQKLEQQQAQEEALRKKAEQKKREREEREAAIETLPPEQRRKAEEKLQRKEKKKANSGKQKMQFFSL